MTKMGQIQEGSCLSTGLIDCASAQPTAQWNCMPIAHPTASIFDLRLYITLYFNIFHIYCSSVCFTMFPFASWNLESHHLRNLLVLLLPLMFPHVVRDWRHCLQLVCWCLRNRPTRPPMLGMHYPPKHDQKHSEHANLEKKMPMDNIAIVCNSELVRNLNENH